MPCAVMAAASAFRLALVLVAAIGDRGQRMHRKPEGDRRAASARPGQRLDPAAVGLDQAAADRQAEARPGCLLVAGAHAIEHVEHGVARFRRDAGALVAHAHAHALAVQRRCDLDPTTGRRVFGGVVENVDQHLLDENRVDVEDRHVLRDLHFDVQRGERPRHLLERPADDLAQIDPFAVRLQRAVAEPGHVEQVLDEAVQPLALLEDGLHQLRAVGIGKRAVTARRARWRSR